MDRRRLIIISGIGALFVLLIIISIVVAVVQKQPKTQPTPSVTTDLRNADRATKQQVADQLSTTIANPPTTLRKADIESIQKQLAYVLRQKYGANSLTGVLRGTPTTNSDGTLSIFVDVKDKNETYLVTYNPANQSAAVDCAPQEDQLSPSTSACSTPPSVDDYYFPNG